MTGKIYRFWLLNEQGLYIFDKKLDKSVILTKAEEDSLIAEIFRDHKVEKNNTTIFMRDVPSTFARLYYQKNRKDLYILLVDELVDITEVVSTFQSWIDERHQQRKHLKGIVLSVFDDIEGPKVVYNSFLEYDNALLLAVQGQTVSSMGRIEDFKTGFKEPLNVPNRDDLIHISFDFLQSAPTSKDPRIAKMGRVSNLYLIFPRDFPHVKEILFREFIESFLDEWVYNWEALDVSKERYSPQIFEELLEDLRSTVSIAIDMTTHEEREIAKLKTLVMDLLAQNKVLEYQVRRLQEKVKELEKLE
ncbi:MAG: hypothetical protein ACFE9L_00620 [Candidatus Hodarchaeota archaeon]